MQITIESTSKVVHLNGVPARVWEGHTAGGIPVHVFVTRIACNKNADVTEFERDLADCRTPSAEIAAYPARLVL